MAAPDALVGDRSGSETNRRMDHGPPIGRIAIVGPAGSGKSTLACQLGEALDVLVIHLDALFLRPGWRAPPREEWRAQIGALVHGEHWILDGNYGRANAAKGFNRVSRSIVASSIPASESNGRKRSVRYV
jgi:hypothetical protein